jgi:hypothetical protein
MNTPRWRVCVLVLLAASFVGADPVDDERILRQANVPADGPSLIALLRKSTPLHVDVKQVGALVERLGSEDFLERERAAQDLITLGALAAPHLRRALRHADRELALRAGACLRVIDTGAGPQVQAAAIRLLAERKPPGAAEALLAYLPYAPDDTVAAAVRQTLPAVAIREGKPEPALLTALADASPLQRQAAGEALATGGVIVPEVRRLLDDADPRVRLTLALVLVRHKEKQAVPVLIDLLGEVPAADSGRIEEVLLRLAGSDAPSIALGSPAAPEKIREQWKMWWQAHRDSVDFSRLTTVSKVLGYTLLVFADTGRVMEVDADGTKRWQIEGLSHPLNAQVIEGDRVLIAEYRGQRVTERDLQGKILWEKKIAWPIAAQRLANGNTFIATRNQLVEIGTRGQETVHSLKGETLMAAQRLPGGNIACLTSAGVFVMLDPAGNTVRRLAGGFAADFGCGFEVLPNGNLLIPETRAGRVAEYDVNGKLVWKCAVPGPLSASRLADGRTLCASTNRALEVDPQGRTVWEIRAVGLTRALRR